MTQSVVEIIDAARALMPMRRRGANSQLYNALVLALQASEICLADPAQAESLRELIATLPRGEKNRQFVERSSDVFQRVCRYVFFGEECHANISRYAISLREAQKQGVGSTELLGCLRDGGVNQFYLKRHLDRQIISTKCIRLDKQIAHNKGEPFTLVLKRKPDNSYDVISFLGHNDAS